MYSPDAVTMELQSRAREPSRPEEWDDHLQASFGLPSLKNWQREAISELLEGRGRALVIAPTGGGKSLCYQFPATELEGTSVVICPLIALMEDQVRGLEERGVPATYLASNLEPAERRRRQEGLRAGRYRLVYVAPERLAREGTAAELAALRPPLVAIDEAHCISQWGHDFRPDYLRLGEVLRSLAPPRVLACTATATPFVREEIVRLLGLGEDTRVIMRGFARPNLHLEAAEVQGSRSRTRLLTRTLKAALGAPSKPAGGAIVYASTRRQSEDVAAVVAGEGYRAAAYHAGLPSERRSEVSHRFAEGALDVVVATNAFGMGIDRPDIRAVVHVQPPGSIEAYYQEVGRAGRDGAPALGLLMSSAADIGLRRRLIERPSMAGEAPDPRLVERQWKLFKDLLRYVDAGSCRHDFILRYFGDEGELLGGCGHCDVCERLEALGGEERVVTDEDALLVKKALSGVARTRRRAGLGAVAKMLHGDRSARITRMGLDRLSTHGLLAEHDEAWVLALLRRLLAAGLVDITPNEFPVPYLTGKGVEVMKGEVPVRVLPPPPTKVAKVRGTRRSATPREPPPGMDEGLFEQLREARRLLAKERGVPAYVVCHDRTLMEIAADRPDSRAALSAVAGMGPARIEAYGERLLEIVRDASA